MNTIFVHAPDLCWIRAALNAQACLNGFQGT